MNLAWEVILRAMEQGQDPHEIQFQPEFHGSPYREASFEALNRTELMEREVNINPLYRFSHIFGTLLDINEAQYPKLREMFFDVFMHYQSQLDLRQGLTKSEYYARAVLRDILSGVYGTKAAEAVTLFTNKEAKNILYGMLNLFKCGTSMELFRKITRTIYPRAMVYRNNDIYREILLYIPRMKSSVDEGKIGFLISMFLDINYTVYTFWSRHFGVIGLDGTLEFGKMLIF